MSSGSAAVNTQYTITRSSDYSRPGVLNQLLPTSLKDVNINYSFEGVDNYQTLLLYGFDAINNMILNVLYTQLEERDFEPSFGSRTLHLLFEQNDSVVPSQVEVELYDRIRAWVPYIDIFLSGIIVTLYPNEQMVELTFVYTEKMSGIKNTFTTYLSNRAQLLRKDF